MSTARPLRLREAARALGLLPGVLLELAESGAVPSICIAGNHFFALPAVEAALAELASRGTAKAPGQGSTAPSQGPAPDQESGRRG